MVQVEMNVKDSSLLLLHNDKQLQPQKQLCILLTTTTSTNINILMYLWPYMSQRIKLFYCILQINDK